MIRVIVASIIITLVKAKFEAALPTKENIGDYLTQQFSKARVEKYDGPLYDDINVVVPNNPSDFDGDEKADEPKVLTFIPPEATVFRGKRQAGFQPAGPVRSAATGAAIVARVDSTSDIVPYDAHIDPDFPAEAPVARGLKNIPEGWNLDKEIDYEFQRGFRKAPAGANPSYAGHQYSKSGSFNAEGVSTGSGGEMAIEGPYMAGGYGNSMTPGYGNMGGYGSSYGNLGYSGIGTGSYGILGGYSGYGSSGYSSLGGYGGLGSIGAYGK